MSNFDFTSQVCTSRSQSERLLALGLKNETADCVMMYYDGWHIGEAEHFDFDKDPVYPAWSLHRLLCLTNPYLSINPYGNIEIGEKSFCDIYEGLISIIEYNIKEGYFNKEYLEEK